jgi:CDP-diacylglycerol--glycerol-3-phosphate 3-phosphatidyltransferase
VLRLVAVPALLAALLAGTSEGRYLAAALFALAIFTDYVDGTLARHHDAVTAFGVVADPIADKLLVGSALIALVSMGRAPTWVVALIIAREALITLLRVLALRRGRVVGANMGGKAKTTLQAAAIMTLILAPAGATFALALLYIALIVTLLSGVAYMGQMRGEH